MPHSGLSLSRPPNLPLAQMDPEVPLAVGAIRGLAALAHLDRVSTGLSTMGAGNDPRIKERHRGSVIK
jgi:hypothetical protein